MRAVPIRRDDEVQVVRGTFKGRDGKVTQVYRRKWVIHVERLTREKVNGAFAAACGVVGLFRPGRPEPSAPRARRDCERRHRPVEVHHHEAEAGQGPQGARSP